MWSASSSWSRLFLGALLLAFLVAPALAIDLWVDPVHGDDERSGHSALEALRTLTAAWSRIPEGVPLTQPYRIRLKAGTYSRDQLPPGGWLEGRHGTASGLVVFDAAGDGAVVLPELDLHDCHHIALRNLTIAGGAGGGNVLHIASCTNISVRGCRPASSERERSRPMRDRRRSTRPTSAGISRLRTRRSRMRSAPYSISSRSRAPSSRETGSTMPSTGVHTLRAARPGSGSRRTRSGTGKPEGSRPARGPGSSTWSRPGFITSLRESGS